MCSTPKDPNETVPQIPSDERLAELGAEATGKIWERKAVERRQRKECMVTEIIRDICELPGDDDPDATDTLVLTVSDLEIILKHHILGDE